jgi:hypothetical protein
VTQMDHKTAESLEGKSEEAIAEVIVKMGLKKSPLLSREAGPALFRYFQGAPAEIYVKAEAKA